MKTTQVLSAIFPLAVAATYQDSGSGSAHGDDGPATPTGTAVGYPGTGTAVGYPGSTTTTPASSYIAVPPTATSNSTPYIGDLTDLGCFSYPVSGKTNPILSSDSSSGTDTTLTFNAKGSCAAEFCATYRYAATQGDKCYCSDSIGGAGLLIATSDKCDTPCPGYALDKCGGEGAATVYEKPGYQGAGAHEDAGTVYGNGTMTTMTIMMTVTTGKSSVTGTKTSGGGYQPVESEPVEAGANTMVGNMKGYVSGNAVLKMLEANGPAETLSLKFLTKRVCKLEMNMNGDQFGETKPNANGQYSNPSAVSKTQFGRRMLVRQSHCQMAQFLSLSADIQGIMEDVFSE